MIGIQEKKPSPNLLSHYQIPHLQIYNERILKSSQEALYFSNIFVYF